MNKTLKILSLVLTGLISFTVVAHGHSGGQGSADNPASNHSGHKKAQQQASGIWCQASDIRCAKTVTSAFAPDGTLWRLWAAQQQLFFSRSSDNGEHFGAVQKVLDSEEKISAKGENRPKLGFDEHNNVYISWAKPLPGRHNSEIRFSYSTDGGKHFAPAQTVNNDGLKVGHSFNEMLVSDDGTVTIGWLDGRERKRVRDYQGSALYTAKGRLTANGTAFEIAFDNTKLADGTCVCCRIAMDDTADGQVAAMWRHIYDDNIRDHAILTFSQNHIPAKPFRATSDQWQLNGCPHQGPGLSVDTDNRYHMVWFNNGSKGKGVFYAYSDDRGKSQSRPLKLGGIQVQAAHANVISNDNIVDLVWTAFNGQVYQLYHRRSLDNGQTFAADKVIAQSPADPDRPFLIKRAGHNFVSWQQPNTGHRVIAL